MAGTKEGGVKAKSKIIEKYGKDFYRNIGRKGGQNGHTGGFAYDPLLAMIAGAKGGKISKRGPAKKNKTLEDKYKLEIERYAKKYGTSI